MTNFCISLFLIVTVRYCQLNSSNNYGFDFSYGWRIGEATGDLYFLENLWSYFDSGLFLAWNVNYFFGSSSYDFYMNVDWVRS